jgi:hypothetical protein
MPRSIRLWPYCLSTSYLATRTCEVEGENKVFIDILFYPIKYSFIYTPGPRWEKGGVENFFTGNLTGRFPSTTQATDTPMESRFDPEALTPFGQIIWNEMRVFLEEQIKLMEEHTKQINARAT